MQPQALSHRGMTTFLQAALDGDPLEGQLLDVVLTTLRGIAGNLLYADNHPLLQPTALVNEAWLRLAGAAGLQVQSRKHFTALAACAMRRVLADYAKAQKAGKRGGGRQAVSLQEIGEPGQERFDMLVLEEELALLEKMDARQARLIELTLFGGLSGKEIAEVTELSPATVSQELKKARTWLSARLR